MVNTHNFGVSGPSQGDRFSPNVTSTRTTGRSVVSSRALSSSRIVTSSHSMAVRQASLPKNGNQVTQSSLRHDETTTTTKYHGPDTFRETAENTNRRILIEEEKRYWGCTLPTLDTSSIIVPRLPILDNCGMKEPHRTCTQTRPGGPNIVGDFDKIERLCRRVDALFMGEKKLHTRRKH